jgi:hypothetical protein
MAKRKSRSKAESPAGAVTQSTPTASEAPPADTRSSSMGSEPSEEDVRMRAYQRYLDRGSDHGGDFDDWLKAEEELRLKAGLERSAK